MGTAARSSVSAAILPIALAAVFATALARDPSTAAIPTAEGQTLWLDGGAGLLKARVFEGRERGEHPPLVLFFHDDSPFQPPVFPERFVRAVAERRPEVVAAAILRPGYTDLTGDRSAGERGRGTGDGYTPEAVTAVATAATALARRYGSREVTLVGQAGGAVVAAGVLAAEPRLASRALLLSCPCDLAGWRQHMATITPGVGWDGPVRSLSPLELVPRFRSDLTIRLLASAEDPLAPLHLAESFVTALAARGLDARLTTLPGSRHDLLLAPAVFEALDALLSGRG